METLRDEKKRWDEVAKRYAEVTAKDEPTKYYTARRLIEVLPKTGRTLEMGCGDGYITDFLAQHCESLTVLDASKEQLETIKTRLPEVKYICSLFEEYVPDKSFDTIVAAHVIEHVFDPVGILKHIGGWCSEGGRIHVVVPNGESLNRRLGVKMGLLNKIDELGENDLAIGHRRIYTLPLLLQHVEEAGLRVINISGIFIKPLAGNQIRNWDKAILEGLYNLGRDLDPRLASELYLETAL